MPQATLTVTIPEEVWIGEISRTYPDAEIRILSAFLDETTGVGLVEITARDVSAVIADIRARDSVTEFNQLQRHEDMVLAQFETTMPLLLRPAQDSGVPLTMPFTIMDGEVEWKVTAPQDRLSELGQQLEEFGIPFSVREIHQQIEATRLLTDRQLRLVTAAVENGYYDTPRQCSLTELAEKVDIAKSTCSETLHRAEEAIIKRFVEGLDSAPLGSPTTRDS